MHGSLKHFASPEFWRCYHQLTKDIQALADKNFALLKKQPRHPSLHLKKVQNYWSVRIGKRYRALGKERKEGIVWFWIGVHAEYDQILK